MSSKINNVIDDKIDEEIKNSISEVHHHQEGKKEDDEQNTFHFASIIPNSFSYFDMMTEKYEKIRKKMKYYKYYFPRETDDEINTEHIVMHFFDDDKTFLFKTRIECLGQYCKNYNMWCWAWSIPILNKAYSTISRNVFLYGTDINISTNTGKRNYELIDLKNSLVNSRFEVDDIVDVEMFCAISSYLAKKPMIIPIKYFNPQESDEFIQVLDYNVSNIYDGDYPDDEYPCVYFLYVLDEPNLDDF